MESRPKTWKRHALATHSFLLRNWRWMISIRDRLRTSEETFHLVLAGGVGVIGALSNYTLQKLMGWWQLATLHHDGDWGAVARDLHPSMRFLFPVLGGLLAGAILFWGLRLVGQQGTSNFLEVVVAGDGRLPLRTSVIKVLSSFFSVGTGGSIGREGMVTHVTAAVASKWGQVARWQPYRLRLLVACGAASGLAAAYNAPVSGAIFAAQIVLGNFSMNLFAPLVFSSVVATMLSRSLFGSSSGFSAPEFYFTSLTQMIWFLLLGLVCGVVGALFLRLLDRCERLFLKLNLPVYLRLMLGGAIVGGLALLYPQVWGNGAGVTSQILGEGFATRFLIGLFLAKLVATLATVGSGAVGGVFTPTLFLGASLGCLLGQGLHHFGLVSFVPLGTFGLVGMGGVLAATSHSPLLATIMIFELSLNYTLMPPLMLACVVSSLVSRHLHPDSIYTAPLQLKALMLQTEAFRLGDATQQTVGDLMRQPVHPIRETATLTEIAERFLTGSNNFLPVVDAKQRLLGVVALQDLKEYLNAGQELNAVIAYDVMRSSPPCLTPSQKLMEALPTLLGSEQRHVPVVNSHKENRLVGSVVRADALGLLSEAISASTASTLLKEATKERPGPLSAPPPAI